MFLKRKAKDAENYIFIKLIGYLLLGVFTFKFNSYPIPLGFIVFLMFFRPKINYEVKKIAAIYGLFLFLVYNFSPVVSNWYFERTIRVGSASQNQVFNSSDIKKDWLKIKNELKISNDVKMNEFRMNDSKDIVNLGYELIICENNNFILYNIGLNNEEQLYEINRRKINQWLQYNELVDSNKFFEVLSILDFEKIKDEEKSKYISTWVVGTRQSYAIKEAKYYMIDSEKGIASYINNPEFPVNGYCIPLVGDSGNCIRGYFYD